MKSSFFQKVFVFVYIDDVNDNYFVFDKLVIDLQILEFVFVGILITIDGVRDADISDRYLFQSYEVMFNDILFEINFQKKLDGILIVRLIVKEVLNRE